MISNDGVAVVDVVAVVLDVLFARHRQDVQVASHRRVHTGGRCRDDLAVGARVVERQVEGERAALPEHAGELDLAAKQHGQLAADREPETGAAVFARGAGVGLLKRLEDQPLLLRRDADASVLDRERKNLLTPC